MRNYVTNLDSIITRHGKNPDDIHVIVGLDIAKNVFQVHAVDLGTGELITKAIKRDQLKEFFHSLSGQGGHEDIFRIRHVGQGLF